jgi:hypothetical protein
MAKALVHEIVKDFTVHHIRASLINGNNGRIKACDGWDAGSRAASRVWRQKNSAGRGPFRRPLCGLALALQRGPREG